jgi:putative transport protein
LVSFLNENPVLLIMLVISAGYIFGQIRIRGFSLESSAILFVALIAGHLGFVIPGLFKSFGLVLFIYAIGLQAGPKVRILFKKEGMVLNLMAILIITSGALLTLAGNLLLGVGKEIGIGLFTGALTSTPGLVSAYEATGSRLTSIGYGIAYPVGVIAVILFVRFLPQLIGRGLKTEEAREREKKETRAVRVISRQVKISNSNVYGKSIKELNFRDLTGCIVSRLLRAGDTLVPNGASRLQQGDIVRVVGSKENIDRAVLLLGKVSQVEIPVGSLELGRFVLTNRQLVGKKIKDLNIRYTREANITRITRAGIDLPALPDFKIQWGDRISVVAEKDHIPELKEFFGDDVKRAEEGNIFSLVLGIAAGILLGLIPFAIGGLFSFDLGLTGGVLLSGIFFSTKGRLGPVVWRIPSNIIHFIREMGLIFFLSSIGCEAGKNFLQVIQQNGIFLILWGAAITVIPMALVVLVVRGSRNVSLLELLGLIPGGMTSTPGFATATGMTDSEIPITVYAAVYPVAMIMMIVWTKILVLF